MPAGNIARPSGDVRLQPLAAGQCISTALVGVAPYCAHGHTTDEAGESRMSFCGHAAKIIAGAGGRRRLENVAG